MYSSLSRSSKSCIGVRCTTHHHRNFSWLFISSLWSDLSMWGHLILLLNLRNLRSVWIWRGHGQDMVRRWWGHFTWTCQWRSTIWFIYISTNLLPVAAHRTEDSPVKKSESFWQCFSNVSQADEEDGNSPEGIDDGDKLRKSSLYRWQSGLQDSEPPSINYKFTGK